MKRRRYLQYNKLYATPLIAPEDFERNLSSYSDVNIVQEFDNIDNPLKKYIYTVSKDIPQYSNPDVLTPLKLKNQHILPSSSGTAIIHEKLDDGTIKTELLSLKVSNTTEGRSKYTFNEGSTQRYVCICQEDTSAYIPMDTEWFFFANATKVQSRAEYYSNYAVGNVKGTTYNTIKYCHIRADIEEIPDNFLYFCTNLTGVFTCPDSVKKIGRNAFYESQLYGIVFSQTNKIQEIGSQAFYSYNTKTEWKAKAILDFPDTLTKIENYALSTTYGVYTFRGGGSGGGSGKQIELLRIPPGLDKWNQPFVLGAVKNVIVSGSSYVRYHTTTSNSNLCVIFANCNNIKVEGVEYSDLDENGQQPYGTVPYGTLVDEIEINGKKYPNKFYIGKDRALHYKENESTDIILGKSKEFQKTKYGYLINEGTTIIDSSYLYSSFDCKYDGITPELVFPKSIQIIQAYSFYSVAGLTCTNPFHKFNVDGTDFYDNLTQINFGETNKKYTWVNPSQDGYFYIPKNVVTIAFFNINSSHQGFNISNSNENLISYDGAVYTPRTIKQTTIDENGQEKIEDVKVPDVLISIPNGRTQELHISKYCKSVRTNTCNGCTKIPKLIFDESDNNESITINGYTFNELDSCDDIILRKNTLMGFWTFYYGKPGITMKIPSGFKSVNKSPIVFYANYFGRYDNQNAEEGYDYTQQNWFAHDGLLYAYITYNSENDKSGLSLMSIPMYYTDIINIKEGTEYIGWNYRTSSAGYQYTLNKSNNLVMPETMKLITNIGNGGSAMHPEIHIHSTKMVNIWSDSNNHDTQLRINSVRPHRICRVPIDACGYDCENKTIQESFIYDGCWSNPVCTKAQQISELRFDLVKLRGQVVNRNGVNTFTLIQFDNNELKPSDESAYKNDHLKEIIVPINDDDSYEVWIKNVKYQVKDTEQYINPIGSVITGIVENSEGKTTTIVTVDFGGSEPTHEKIQDITL